jgi:hypothetical protein
MASTRTKNTPGNYELEQWTFDKNVGYCTAECRGAPIQTYFPGDGLLAGSVSRTQLSNNYCDIESMLLGIGSTNLVSPQSPIQPEIKYLQSLNITNKLPLYVPAPLIIQGNQRPLMN